MSAYKALVTDLDGTAVKISSEGSDVSEAAKRAVRVAQEKGFKITCATGRRWDSAKPIVKRLGIASPCIVQGGSRIIDPVTEETLWEKHLDASAAEATLDIFKRESDSGDLLTSTVLHQPLHTIDRAPDNAQFMYLLNIPTEIGVRIANTINAQAFAVAHLTPAWDGEGKIDVHVTHPEATKEHAIAIWQTMVGVSKEATIGMGDSGNDIPLFLSAGLRVAVGNATEDLKQLADYIAPAQNDEALAHVINHFMLSEKLQ
ncbi:MAG: HAD-superfamily hydrolase, subfamily [Candidatus Saccharibacteria bacterium]|nr:HAD-superfamily hydrolase, subfamily [Candidatus Saccharibacteria bacterium]